MDISVEKRQGISGRPIAVGLLEVFTLFQIGVLCLMASGSMGDAITTTLLKYLTTPKPLEIGRSLPDITAYSPSYKQLDVHKLQYPACLVVTSCSCQVPHALEALSNLGSTHEEGILLTPATADELDKIKNPQPLQLKVFSIRTTEIGGLAKGYPPPFIVHVGKDGEIISIEETN